MFGPGVAASPSEAFVLTVEVVEMLRGEMQPHSFPRTHRLLQLHFRTEGVVTMAQVQDLGRIRHRHFDHLHRARQTWVLTRTGETSVFRPEANGDGLSVCHPGAIGHWEGQQELGTAYHTGNRVTHTLARHQMHGGTP